MNRTEAVERLAARLRATMDHLEPSATYDLAWEELRDRDRDLYRLCIKAVLRDELVVQAAMSAP